MDIGVTVCIPMYCIRSFLRGYAGIRATGHNSGANNPSVKSVILPYLHGSSTVMQRYCYGITPMGIAMPMGAIPEQYRSNTVGLWANRRRIGYCVFPGLPGPKPYTNFPDEPLFRTGSSAERVQPPAGAHGPGDE